MHKIDWVATPPLLCFENRPLLLVSKIRRFSEYLLLNHNIRFQNAAFFVQIRLYNVKFEHKLHTWDFDAYNWMGCTASLFCFERGQLLAKFVKFRLFVHKKVYFLSKFDSRMLYSIWTQIVYLLYNAWQLLFITL